MWFGRTLPLNCYTVQWLQSQFIFTCSNSSFNTFYDSSAMGESEVMQNTTTGYRYAKIGIGRSKQIWRGNVAIFTLRPTDLSTLLIHILTVSHTSSQGFLQASKIKKEAPRLAMGTGITLCCQINIHITSKIIETNKAENCTHLRKSIM